MKHIVNEGLLLIAAFVLIYTQHIAVDTRLIAAILLSMIASAIYPALSGISASTATKYDRAGIQGGIYSHLCETLICLYLISVFFLEPMYFFVSLVSYDIYRYRQRFSSALLVLLSVYTVAENTCAVFLPQLCLVAFSLILSVYSCHVDSLRSELLSLRDNTVEHDMLVAENTRQLLRNQDNMVLTATLSERNRIAREIHDNVGHMLTRSILQTGAIKVINKDERLTKPLEQLQSTLDTAMDSMRNSVHDLHDESVNLRVALNDITAGVHDIDITLDYDMSEKLPKDVKYSFINIVKESINNTLKHSNGDHMDIRLREHPAFYQLSIADNGTDIHMSGQGMGLFSIQERVNMLGGSLKLSTDNGFRLLITIMKGRDHDI